MYSVTSVLRTTCNNWGQANLSFIELRSHSSVTWQHAEPQTTMLLPRACDSKAMQEQLLPQSSLRQLLGTLVQVTF